MELRNTRTIVLNQGQACRTREDIQRYFHATFTLDERLWESLAKQGAFWTDEGWRRER